MSTSCRCNIRNDTLWILKTPNERTKRQNTETQWTEMKKKVPAATHNKNWLRSILVFKVSQASKYKHASSLYTQYSDVSHSRYRLSIQIAFISFTSLYVRWHDVFVCVCCWFDLVALHHYQVGILSIFQLHSSISFAIHCNTPCTVYVLRTLRSYLCAYDD